MSLNFDNLSVKELKAYLDEQQINYDGCFERSEFIQLAKGQIAPAAGTMIPEWTRQPLSPSSMPRYLLCALCIQRWLPVRVTL